MVGWPAPVVAPWVAASAGAVAHRLQMAPSTRRHRISPNGNDDDVVARQLREAAMREPDPAIREKLWAEYRKYKGIAEPDA